MGNEFAERAWDMRAGVLPLRQAVVESLLRAKDPACHGMTDFTRTCPFTITPQRQIDGALADMKGFGVRALLVVESDRVIGLITAYDIDGVRAPRATLQVCDVMIGWDDLPTVDWMTMQSANIGDLLDIFHGVGVMHLLVVETHGMGMAPVVRGLVSRARLEHRLSATP